MLTLRNLHVGHPTGFTSIDICVFDVVKDMTEDTYNRVTEWH